MRVETVTHASRRGFDELLNRKLSELEPWQQRAVEVQYRPVLTVAKRTRPAADLADGIEGTYETEDDVLLFTALIQYPAKPERNLPA